MTIEDVPCHILKSLLNDSPLLSNVYSLSIDINCKRYHYFEYKDFIDSGIIIPILKILPELRSPCQHERSVNGSKSIQNGDFTDLQHFSYTDAKKRYRSGHITGHFRTTDYSIPYTVCYRALFTCY